MLIYMQKPDATLVAGFNKWKDQFERHVNRGEKGIKIIAPVMVATRQTREKRDPQTHSVILDQQGQAITEEIEVKVPHFRVASVFDISQTDGKPLPTLVNDLHENVEHFDAFMEAVLRSSPVPLEIGPIKNGADHHHCQIIKKSSVHPPGIVRKWTEDFSIVVKIVVKRPF